jgi:glycosyltransferase involved in cell wall biosynthesis
MRILWISHFLPYPPKAGLLQRGYHLVKELARYSAVDLLAFNQPRLLEPVMPATRTPLTAAINELEQFTRVRGVMNIPLARMPYGRSLLALDSLFHKRPYETTWLKSRRFAEMIESTLAEQRYDVIHLDTIGLAVYLDLIRRNSQGARLSLGHHNIESHMLHRRASRQTVAALRHYFALEAGRLETYEREVCPQVDLNITCSDLDSERLAMLTRAPLIVTVENGVDIAPVQPASPVRQAGRLLFVGTMNWYPNADAMRFFLAEVWPGLTAVCPDVSLDIIGNAPPRDIARAGEHDRRIRVHGFVDDIQPYLDRAGLYICPIRDGGGTKLKVLEAFAAGIPMVAHPLACEGIPAIDRTHVWFAESAADFKDAIVNLLHDEHERSRLARAARHLVEQRYGFPSIGQQLQRHFAALVMPARGTA